MRQSLQDLMLLATAAHRLNCGAILKLCDDTLVLRCGAAEHPDTQRKPSSTSCLTAANVAVLYALDGDLQMTGEACLVWQQLSNAWSRTM